MTRPPPLAHPRQPTAIERARGTIRLAVDGVRGVTHITQGLHGTIASVAPPIGRVPERPASGIAGFVYGAVRSGAGLVGSGLDAVLAAAQKMQSGRDTTEAGREATNGAGDEATTDAGPRELALRAALNGVVGDHLARTNNPLAIAMALRVRGPATPHLLLLVHGLCMHDGQWLRKGHDHGQALANALRRTPVYLRYNSGRHVSENGAELAQQLEQLVVHWPVPVETLAIVGHSMGGLVARSAVHQASSAKMAWPSTLKQMVFLGTPHHGAPLERGGNWLHTVLGWSPYLAPFTRLGRLRSDGITDLRHGNLLAGDWRPGRHLNRDTRQVVPLPRGVACYAIAGALESSTARAALGDGLVSVDSALGRHARPSHRLRFGRGHTWVAQGTHHLDLLSDPEVCARLLSWLR